MKDELSAKLVEIIGAIQTGVGKASDFAVEQLPDIAQQYIAFGRGVETVTIVLALIFGVLLPYVCVTQAKKAVEAPHNKDFIPAIISAISGFGSLIAVSTFFFNLQSFLMVWFAPKIYLIKGLAGLLK